ncbi:MAG: hypothetical protein ABIG61_04170 [Planctomycetota bacterium]
METGPVAVTKEPKHHFFGYYEKCPWSASGRYILSHELDFKDRPPTGGDAATLGVVDLESDNHFEPVAQTFAWNWQQGAMLQWWPGEPENKIVYNDRRDNQFVCVIHDIHSSQEKVLPRPVAAVSRDGKKALSLNFARLADERPGYGYEGLNDKFKNETASDKDGIYVMDMETGTNEMIVSLAQIATRNPREVTAEAKHWFNHLLFSPDDRRFIFLHRWRAASAEGIGYAHFTEMFTANIDGSDIYCLNDHEMTSHFDWRNNNQVLAFARRHNLGDKYYLFTDKDNKVEIIGDEKLTPLYDGHCIYSPDHKWILTDTYPNDERLRLLLLYNPEKDIRIDLGAFYEPEWKMERLRCDLHPRWSRDGKQICFDAVHTGSRQVYIMDIVNRIAGIG